MKYGAVLQAVRERAGFSQDQLAARLNVSRSCISKYENDRKEIPLSLSFLWAKETKSKEVLVSYLFGAESVALMTMALQLIGA